MSHVMLSDYGQEFCEHAGVKITTPKDFAQRIYDEWTELYDSRTTEEFGQELADIVLACCTAAHMLGINLDEAVNAKHERNLAARWTTRPNGSVERVKAT